MTRDIFAFTLTTTEEFEKGGTIFSTDGDFVGRILYKSKTTLEGNYTYHVESTKDLFERINAKEVIPYHVGQYYVSTCNVRYTRD